MNYYGTLLQELCTIEQYAYTLEKVSYGSNELNKKIDNAVFRPAEPTAPKGYFVDKYPVYNEKEYIKKAKTKGKEPISEKLIFEFGEVGIRLCYTVIGFPFGIMLLLLAALCLPFRAAARVRIGRQMYEKECEEIDMQNRQYKSDVERYNREMVVYNQQRTIYNMYRNTVPQREMIVKACFDQIQKTRRSLVWTCEEMYKSLKLPPNCRNFPSIILLLTYFSEGRVSTIHDAVSLYNIELQRGTISPDADFILKNKNAFISNMPTVVKTIESAASLSRDMLDSYATAVTKNTQTYADEASNSKLSKYIETALNYGNKALEKCTKEI